MITKFRPQPKITVTPPEVKFEPKVSPIINVSPAQPQVVMQSPPDVHVEVMHKPCVWLFDIKRDKFGRVAQITATPK